MAMEIRNGFGKKKVLKLFMASPLFRNHWNYPRYAPVQREMTPAAIPKVVSIPVHFVGLERRRSDSAMKIQKVFRGFLVRKSVKKVMEIRREVDEIERRLLNEEIVDLIRNDAKERIKVSETLMSLLLKLDSVNGVDSGVRVFRKGVIKKAIALQEKVDSIVAEEFVDQSLEVNGSDAKESENSVIDNIGNDCDPVDAQPDTYDEDKREIESADDFNDLENGENAESRFNSIGNEAPDDDGETSETESQTDSSANPPNLVEDDVEIAAEEEEEDIRKKGREEDKKSRELLEKMVTDNKKMMEMMGQLFERNEMQTQLLSSLSRRVEQLEKAFVCETLRRKKKRNGSYVDGSGKCPKSKKFEE